MSAFQLLQASVESLPLKGHELILQNSYVLTARHHIPNLLDLTWTATVESTVN
jgi:hypothetical protein